MISVLEKYIEVDNSRPLDEWILVLLNLVRTFKWLLGKIVMNTHTMKVAKTRTEKDIKSL